MAHPLNDLLDRVDGETTKICDKGCECWKFPHLETACVLSEVYSVKKGEPCFIYKEKAIN
jgi:hypothetical protein